MISEDLDLSGAAKAAKRSVAVVADAKERATEIEAQFAKQGEAVTAVWFTNPHDLLSDKRLKRFSAVVLFPSKDEAQTDANEQFLRRALTAVPIYRVA